MPQNVDFWASVGASILAAVILGAIGKAWARAILLKVTEKADSIETKVSNVTASLTKRVDEALNARSITDDIEGSINGTGSIIDQAATRLSSNIDDKNIRLLIESELSAIKNANDTAHAKAILLKGALQTFYKMGDK
jgi:hypothetical protein